MDKSLIIAVILWPLVALGQTHTFPGNNVFPSTSTTDFNAGATVDFTGATVTGLPAGGAVTWGTITGTLSSQTDLNTALSGKQPIDTDLTTIAGLTATTDNFMIGTASAWSSRTPTQARTSLALVIGTNVEAWDTDLDTWATLTPSANFQTMVPHTFSQMRTDLSLVPGTNVEVPLTFSTGLTRSTNTVTVNSAQAISTLSGLTTNGFVRTSGSTGFLSVDTATYQPSDADLTTWAGITPVAAVGTWIATPSSANLRSALTDENGTGAALFSGATTPDFTTGFTIGGAAATGKILIGNGTNYVPSTPTWPTTAGTAGKVVISDGTNLVPSTPTYPNAAGTAAYTMRSDGSNFTSYPQDMLNSSTTVQALSTSDVYIAGSSIVVAAGDFKQKGQYRCLIEATKSAGTGGISITLRIGTAGTTSDASIQTYTFAAGTSVADTATFEIIANFRSVGSGTSAVVNGICRSQHNLENTGMYQNVVPSVIILGSPLPSAGFNSSTATTIGVSFNGGTAFAANANTVQAQLVQ